MLNQGGQRKSYYKKNSDFKRKSRLSLGKGQQMTNSVGKARMKMGSMFSRQNLEGSMESVVRKGSQRTVLN